ncbi:MAG TPA: PEGA domain-containing protein [Kofleriaceae bacterium]|nr:PEGA domain-containing protein [Kofleriaceae bacterium]
MSRVIQGIAAALVFFVYVGSARAQPAQPSPDYLKAYSLGIDAYNAGILKGDFAEAKRLFAKTAELDDRFPGPFRYLALIAKAEKAFEACLLNAFLAVKLNPTADTAPATRTIHADCRKELGRPEFRGQYGGGGAIWVATPGVDGAKVILNGLTYGATPFEPRAFAIGSVEVKVTKEGFLDGSARAEILEGMVTDVIFELEKDPNAVGVGTGDPTQTADQGWVKLKTSPPDAKVTFDGKPAELDAQGRIKAAPGTYEVNVTASGHEPWNRRVRVNQGQSREIDVSLRTTALRQSLRKKGYISLAVAAGLGIVGATFGIMELHAHEEASDIWTNETTRPSNAPLADTGAIVPVKTRDDLQDATDRGKRYQVISAVSFGLAAAALGASIYFFAQERPAERPGFKLPLAFAPIVPVGPEGGVGAKVTYSRTFGW